MDWYAEYEAPPAESPRRVRLSGHGGSLDEVVEPMGGWTFEPVRVGDAHGLVFAAPLESEPTVVAFGAGPALSLMALSCELPPDELIRWLGDLVPASEAEWVGAGGRVDR